MKIGFVGLGIMGEAMCGNIIKNNAAGLYDGAYNVVRIAMEMKNG